MSNAPRFLSVSTLVASAATLAMCAGLSWSHRSADEGLSAEEIEAATADLSMAEAEALGAADDTLLFDFVEPEDGEGGSESELAALRAELEAAGLSVEPAGFYSEGEHLFRVRGSEAALEAARAQLAAHPLVETIEPEFFYSVPDGALSAYDGPALGYSSDEADIQKPSRPRVEVNDPMRDLQWHLDAINAPEAWAQTRGEGAIIAVIDTGVAYKDFEWNGVHAKAVPDLVGVEMVGGATFLDRALPDGLDDHAHGTHVAGTIAQATDNGIGVAGVAHGAKIMPLKVLSGDGRGSVAAIANAIRYAADNGADVINMSLGGPLPSSAMSKAVAYAHSKGTTVICAAGNEKRSKVSYPAAYKHSVSVAATNWEGTRSFYSNWGKKLDISAPGGDTRSDKNGDGHPDGVLQNTIKIQDPSSNDYLWFQGTSMAAPHAAGVAGLIASSGVNNPDEVERILKETAKHPNKVEWDSEYGAGIIDAEAAVSAARSKQYAPERGGLLAALGIFLLPIGAGAGAAASGAAGRGRKLGRAAMVAGGGLLGAGLLGAPTAYGLWGLAGGGALSGAMLLSALVPVLVVGLMFHKPTWRALLAGFALGWAALLAHGAVVLPTMLDAVPGGPTADRAWLALNAAVCVWLARAVFRKGADSQSNAS